MYRCQFVASSERKDESFGRAELSDLSYSVPARKSKSLYSESVEWKHYSPVAIEDFQGFLSLCLGTYNLGILNRMESSVSKWLPLAIQIAKCLHEDGGTNSLRSIIQEEMKKTKNQDQNETMKEMLMMIEMKHATELSEANRERDMFKIRAEYLSKRLEEFYRNKKAGEKSEKIKDLLTCLAQLRLQPNETTQNTTASASTSSTTRSPLPWMDPDKSCPQTNTVAKRGNGQKNYRGYYSGQRGFKRGGSQRGFNRNGRGAGRNHNTGPVHQLQGGFNRNGNQVSSSFDGQVTMGYRNQQAQFSRGNQMQHRGRGYRQRSRRGGRGSGRTQGHLHYPSQENPLLNSEIENKKKEMRAEEEPIKCCICC